MTTIALLGATGRTGQQVIAQAPARGVKIKALARDPSKLAGLDLEVVAGDVRDEAALRRLFTGTDAVISALGPRSLRVHVQSGAMGGLITAMRATGVKRYVGVTSAAAVLPGERLGRMLRGLLWVAKALVPAYVEDKKAEAESLVASELEWTLIRVPGLLVDGEGSDVAVSFTPSRGPPRPAQRQAVARVMLDAVLERKWIRQAPYTPGMR
jgi:putative NADH-flavin reductase